MFKIDVGYRVGDREVSAEAFGDAFVAAGIEEAVESVKTHIAQVVCTVHAVSPSSITVTINGNDVSWDGIVCCEALRRAVQESL